MKKKENDIQKYSEDFKVILEKPPVWFIRSGMVLLFGLIAAAVFFCWIFRLPESVNGEILIVAKNARKPLVSKSAGRVSFLVSDGQLVKEGQTLGIIQRNNVTKENTLELIQTLESIYPVMYSIYSDTLQFNEKIYVGELQSYYNDFLRKRKDYFTYTTLRVLDQKKSDLEKKLTYYLKIEKQCEIQNELFKKKYDIESKRLSNANYLANVNAISDADHENAKEAALNKEQMLESEKEKLIQTKMEIQDIKGQVTEINMKQVEDSIQYKVAALDAFKLLYSMAKNWENTHVLKSPADGKVYFNKYWSNGQNVNENEEIFSLLPNDEHIFGIAEILQERSGEVKKGQMVKIELQGYLPTEHGIIIGTVKDISPIPFGSKYKVTIELPNGLQTSYGHKIPFTPELLGKAEIVSKNLRVLEKIFYKIKRASDNINSGK